jgi:hypothetical protein
MQEQQETRTPDRSGTPAFVSPRRILEVAASGAEMFEILELIGNIGVFVPLFMQDGGPGGISLSRASLLDMIRQHPVARRVHRDLVRARRFRCRLFPYVWRVRSRLSERFGQRCRVNARGGMNSCEVEFEDGSTVITSRNYLRRARH